MPIRSGQDRDAVRLSLTAEGGLNDGSALPAVMLGLGLMGLHDLGRHDLGLQPGGPGLWRWAWSDLLWPVGGAARVGVALGAGLGWLMGRRMQQGEDLARDELHYLGTVVLGFGLARWWHCSTFVVVFAAGAVLLHAFDGDRVPPPAGMALAQGITGPLADTLIGAVLIGIALSIVLHGVSAKPLMAAFQRRRQPPG